MPGFFVLFHILNDNQFLRCDAKFRQETNRSLFRLNPAASENYVIHRHPRGPTGGRESIQHLGRLVQTLVQLRRQVAKVLPLHGGIFFRFSIRWTEQRQTNGDTHVDPPLVWRGRQASLLASYHYLLKFLSEWVPLPILAFLGERPASAGWYRFPPAGVLGQRKGR